MTGNLFESYLRFPDINSQEAKDLAYTFQKEWTNELLDLIKGYTHVSKNLCIVGGCALNGITNYKLQQKGIFDNIHLIPNPSDCGLSVGAALYTYYRESGENFKGYGKYFSPYAGERAYDSTELDRYKKEYCHIDLKPENVIPEVAKLISQNYIIGIIREGYEIGPRALGNRSILCNPLDKDMRNKLNEKVKHREWYRPFAPVCTLEDSHKYFTNLGEIPYMSTICYTKEEYKSEFPSITHVDGSARLQTVTRIQNGFLYDVLKEFEKIKGAPVLLNTSFNPGGEPILNYYKIGLEMLRTTGLDMVLIENTLFVSDDLKNVMNHIDN